MKQWLLIILIVFLQETVTLNGLLVKAHQGDYSIWVITGLFVIATAIDIVVGYVVGKRVKHHWNKGGIKLFATKWSHRFNLYIGKHGRKIYLLLLGFFSFPYLNAFITAWLNVPFWESFWYLFFGNMIFYVTSLLLVLGITWLIPNPLVALLTVVVVTIAVTVITRIWKTRKI